MEFVIKEKVLSVRYRAFLYSALICKKRTVLGNFSDPKSVRRSVNLLNVFDVPTLVLGTWRATKK